jgi:hypothetical protein
MEIARERLPWVDSDGHYLPNFVCFVSRLFRLPVSQTSGKCKEFRRILSEMGGADVPIADVWLICSLKSKSLVSR